MGPKSKYLLWVNCLYVTHTLHIHFVYILENWLNHPILTSIALSLHKEVNKSNKKIQSQQDAEIIIHKFKDHKLLTNCKDTEAIILSTKFIFEMEAYLKENYPDLPQCTKCEKEERGQKIIIRPIGVFHLHLLIFFFVYQFNSKIGSLFSLFIICK